MTSTLALFQESEGIVRCQRRIGLSSLPYDTKFHVLLRREYYFTRLVIPKCHEQVMHNRVAETLVHCIRNNIIVSLKGDRQLRRY